MAGEVCQVWVWVCVYVSGGVGVGVGGGWVACAHLPFRLPPLRLAGELVPKVRLPRSGVHSSPPLRVVPGGVVMGRQKEKEREKERNRERER